MAKISVMGTGSWGTALAILLHNNGHEVMLWSAHPEKAVKSETDPGGSEQSFRSVKIPEGIMITGDATRQHWQITRYGSICLPPSAYMRTYQQYDCHLLY